MTLYALRLQNGVDTAPRARMADALSLQHDGPLNARGGLRPDGGGAVTVVVGTMSVQVSPFIGWADGGTSDAQGGYPVVLDAATTLTLDPGEATLARVDTIAVVLNDAAFDGSGTTGVSLVVVKGAPGGTAPALPATAIALRDVNVPAGKSAGNGGLAPSNLGADRRRYVVASGGVLPVSGAGERDAVVKRPGQAVFRQDTGKLELYDGTTWLTFKREDGLVIQSGRVQATLDTNSRLAITFPQAFNAPPTVTLTVENGGYSANITGSPSATGVTAQVQHWSSGTNPGMTCTVDWIAVGSV